MRQIGILDSEAYATRFSAYLSDRKIDHSIDASFDPTTERASYVVWITNEDQIPEATEALKRFQQNPSASTFKATFTETVVTTRPQPEPEIAIEQVRSPTPRVTIFLIALCSIVFFLSTVQEIPLLQEGLTPQSFFLTPIEAELLYDVPPAFEQLEATIEKYQVPMDQKIEELPPEVKAEIAAIDKIPFWRGIYDWVVLKSTGQDADAALGPMFYKIRQGQFWRLITPVLLHAGLLHIGFNMIWLWLLGKQIELRIGMSRYLLLSLAAGIFSNTVQYLMSGPFFLGYSGIITALAGFIWSREKVAPWEGYPLQRSLIIFLVLFILAMFALQFGSFLLTIFTSVHFNPNIANAAHIAGAIFGVLVGRLSWFNARGSR